MNIVSTGDVLHHHSLNVSVGGTDEEADMETAVSPDEDGRTRRRPTRGQSRIEFERLASFFHVPINEAAKGLGVCATVLKKVCRKHGIPRWPHRKIKKLDTMLAMLETAATKPGNPQHDDDVRKKIDAVNRDRHVLMTEGKLVGEGKSEGKRRSEGRAREARKRKKPDDDDDEEAENEADAPQSNSYHAHNGNNEQDAQAMVVAPSISHMNHMSALDMNGMGYNPYGYSYGLSGYSPSALGLSAGSGAAAMALNSGNYAYSPMYWSAMNNNVSLPGVHSISSGTAINGMMGNLPPPLSSLNLPATPISPLTPTLSASNPLPLPAHKHAKLAHTDVLLDHPNHYAYHTSPSSRGLSHMQPTHLYSEYSVQHESPTDPHASHFRLFGEIPGQPTSATE